MKDPIHRIHEVGPRGDAAAPSGPSQSGFAGAALSRIGAPGAGESRHSQMETVWIQRSKSLISPAAPKVEPMKRVPKFPQTRRVGLGTGCTTGSGSRVRTVEKCGTRRGRTGSSARVTTVRYLPGQRKKKKQQH